MSLLIKNIKGLVQVRDLPLKKSCGSQMSNLKVIDNAFLYFEDGKIADYGTMNVLKEDIKPKNIIDASGCFVFPCYIDSHTHIVNPGSRESEFVMKIKGASYEEIYNSGGGILNSAKRLQTTSEEELFTSAMKRLDEMICLGTGAVEIKSGYGLSLEGEIKMLRVIKKIKEKSPVPVKATFLGAHAIPVDYKNNRSAYIKLIIDEMLPAIAMESLADYIDVFCDKGFFTVEETCNILEAGMKYGLKPKIHANEMDFSGGVQVGVQYNAVSVDHLEKLGDEEINILLSSHTMPTLLPSTAFFLNFPYAPARKMIDAGLPVAIATDYNPGSSPSGNINFSASLACIKMKMLPEEAINAATVNASFALELQDRMGAISKGFLANVFITKPIPSYTFLPYSFGNPVIETVIINGEIYKTLK